MPINIISLLTWHCLIFTAVVLSLILLSSFFIYFSNSSYSLPEITYAGQMQNPDIIVSFISPRLISDFTFCSFPCLFESLLMPFLAGIMALQQQFHVRCQLLGSAEKNLHAVTQDYRCKIYMYSWTPCLNTFRSSHFRIWSCSDYN